MTKSNPDIKSMNDLRQAAINAHHKGDLDQARNFYRAYLQNMPKDAAIWSNLGALFRKQKNYELAMAAQLRALELEPDTLALMNNAANAFYDAGHIDKSLVLRQKTVKLEPDNPDHYVSLGKCYRGLHKLRKARQALSDGIKKLGYAVDARAY